MQTVVRLEELVQQPVVFELGLVDALQPIAREQGRHPFVPKVAGDAPRAEGEVLVRVGDAGVPAIDEAAHAKSGATVVDEEHVRQAEVTVREPSLLGRRRGSDELGVQLFR